MTTYRSLDALVRYRLRQWPQSPPGLGTTKEAWLRGRPSDETTGSHPFLKFPGSDRMRTLPDGLWLNFGGTPVEPFVDIFAIEACSSLPNLLDKRSRFAPSTHSLLAVCPVPWLLSPAIIGDSTPRWHATGVLQHAPVQPLILPVRDIRVMYALKQAHYEGFAGSQVPHPHEYFMPMDALTAKDAHEDPVIQAFVGRATAVANFLTRPSAQPTRRRGHQYRSLLPPIPQVAARARDHSPSTVVLTDRDSAHG